MQTLELMGPAEIMDAYKIPRNTFYRWVRQGTFPPPYQTLRAIPIWDQAAVEKFLGKRPN